MDITGNGQQIDKIYIDIETTDSSLSNISKLQKLITNLQSSIEKINNTKLGDIVKSTARSTKNNLKEQEKSAKNIATIYKDANNAILKSINTYIDDDNKTTTSIYGLGGSETGKLLGQIIKEDGTKTITNYTKNIAKGVKSESYAFDEMGNKFLQQVKTTKQVGDGFETVNEKLNQYGQTLKKVTTNIDEFGNKTITTIDNQNKLAQATKQSSVATDELADKSKNASRSTSSLFDRATSFMAKITIMGYGINKIRGWFSEFITMSNQYIENLNLFRVTFGKFAEEAEDFANTYSMTLGLDPSEVERNMGFFNQIATGFGVVKSDAYQMSKLLTQLSYDLSSFINIDVEEAVTKFQSGLAGELEPLRRVGYALDEVTLQQVAYNHGIQKSFRTMSQAEKSYLRVIAMYEQSANVMGDLAGTITSPANAIRLLGQQLTLFKRSIGNMLVPIITKILPYVKGTVKALTEFFNLIATNIFHYEIQGARENSIAEQFDDISKSASDATNAVEGALLPFDKFISLSTEDKKGIGFTIDIPDYDPFEGLTDIGNVAEDVYKTIRKIFVSEDGKQFSETMQAVFNVFKNIYNILKKLFEIGWKIIVAVTPAIVAVLNILSGIINYLDEIHLLTAVIHTIFTAMIIKDIIKGFALLKPIFTALQMTIFKIIGNLYLLASTSKIASISMSAIGLVGGLALIFLFDNLNSKAKIWTGAILGLASAIAILFASILAVKGALTWGVAVPIITTAVGVGIASVITMIKGIKGFATGGFTPETTGSLFMAGENGKPELMGTVGGKNAVANVDSIETAMENASYRGMVKALNSNNSNNRDIVLQINSKELARATVGDNASALSSKYRIDFKTR